MSIRRTKLRGSMICHTITKSTTHAKKTNAFTPRAMAFAVHVAFIGGLATTGWVPEAQAQEPNAQTIPQANAYNIPAGPLAPVLNHFAEEAGALLTASSEITKDKTSPGLKGSYSVQAGFAALLAGSGLEAFLQSDGSYGLRVAPITNSSEVSELPTVMVKAEADHVTDGSTETGYVTKKISAVGPWQGRELQDTPYSIMAIPQELIENLQATTPDQIFRINPTTQLSRPQYDIDNPYVIVRGFQLATPYRDGMRGDGYGYGTTTEDVERIEVLSGLSGFLYGPGNVGGLMNYVSKRPTAERLNRVTLGNNGGSNYYLHGDFGGPIDSEGRFGYRLNVIHQDGDTAIDNMRIKKTFFSGALDWHITDTLLLTLNAAHRDYDVLGGPAYWTFESGVTRPSASKIDTSKTYSQPWTRKYSEVQRYGAQLQWSASDAMSIRMGWRESGVKGGQNATFNAIQSDGSYNQSINNVAASGVDPMLWDVETSVGSAFADLLFTTGFIQHKLTVGMQYEALRQERYSTYPDSVSFSDLSLSQPTYFDKPVLGQVDRGPRIKVTGSTQRNLMIGDDITFNPQWSALIGLAHSTIEIDEITGPILPRAGYRDSAVTPTVSLIYKPAESVTTYVSYIESLEAGNIAAEQFRGYDVVNAGQILEPLISSQIEVGTKVTLGGMLLTAALFEIDKSLQYYDISNPTLPRYVQDGRQVHRGGEFTAVGKATERLTLIGGLTLLDAEVKKQKQNPALEGKRPTQVAETLAKLRAEYQIPGVPGLTVLAGVHYVGKQYGNVLNTDEIPAYTILDAGARYATQLSGRPLILRLEANNLGDKRYWTNLWHTGTPRTVLFSASMEF